MYIQINWTRFTDSSLNGRRSASFCHGPVSVVCLCVRLILFLYIFFSERHRPSILNIAQIIDPCPLVRIAQIVQADISLYLSQMH